MSSIDPAAVDSGSALSVDLTDLHDAVLSQLSVSEASRRKAHEE